MCNERSVCRAGLGEVVSISWLAHGGKPVLSVFWVASLGAGTLATAALDGNVRIWSVDRLFGSLQQTAATEVRLWA